MIGKDGKLINDIEPYLSAPMHLAVVKSDLTRFMHTHGELPRSFFDKLTKGSNTHIHSIISSNFGSPIDAYILFPENFTIYLVN